MHKSSFPSIRCLWLLVFVCCLAVAGMVLASGHYPESGTDPDEGGPCKCPPSDGPCPDDSGAPVLLMRGSVKESATDLSIPGPLGGWKHSREYDSLLDTRTYNNSNYNVHGRRWTGGPQSMYLRRNGNNMELFLSSSNKRTFADNDPGKANGTFTGPSDLNATLTKSVAVDHINFVGTPSGSGTTDNEIPLSYLVYTLTYPESGDVYIFREKDPADPCWGITGTQNNIIPASERTNLTYLTQGLIGETYYYNSNGKLALIVTAAPQSYFIQYSYNTTGYANGCLKKIEVYNGSPELEGTAKIAQAEYTYVDYVNADYAVGYPGDLAQVKVSELLSDGVSWDHKYTQYRGYDYEYEGYYQLKSVYEADAIEQIMENNTGINQPEDLLRRYDYEGLSSGNTIASYASRSFTYYNYDISTDYNIGTAWGNENLRSKYGGNDRSEVPTYPYLGLVQNEIVNSGCSSCGGSTTGGLRLDYYYMTLNSFPSSDSAGDSNIVVYLTIVDTKDSTGTPLYRTIYGLNWHGVAIRKAMIENPNAATLNTVCTSKIFDENGKEIEERPEEAHTLVNTNAKLTQFLNPFNGSSWANDLATLEPSKGVIKVYEYDSTTKRKIGTKVKVGSGGTAYYVSANDYNAEGQIAAEYVYPTQTTNREASDRVSTSYQYTYWDDNHKEAIKVKTETKQAVPVSQNGSGIPAVSKVFYDSYGKARWIQDALGIVAYQGYHPLTLQQTITVRDVDTGSLPAVITTDSNNIVAWSGAAPFQRDSSLETAFNQTSVVEYDLRGRAYASTEPDGVTSYTIRDAKKTMQFKAWDTNTQKSILPISVTEVNAIGKPISVYQLAPSAVVVADGKPTGINAGATKNTWTRYHYGSGGSLDHVDRYHLIPASGNGVIGTNYYRTTNIHDNRGRQIATAQFVEVGKWQVSRQKWDWRSRPIEQMQGVAINAPVYTDLNNASWLKTISKTIYNGNKTERTLSYFNTGATDYIGTIYRYDPWNRLRAATQYSVSGTTKTSFGPYTVQDLDWRGNIMATAQFETEPNWTSVVSDENYASATTSNRLTFSKNSYDIFGRTWKTEVRDNVAANFIETSYQYDLAGRTVVSTNDDQSQEMLYDALGRQIEEKTKNFNIVMTLSNNEYDSAGRMTGQHSLTLNPGETVGINVNGTNFVRNTQYFWHDNAGRTIVQANYGSGGAIWAHFAKPARPESAPMASSESCLVTKTAYSSVTGWAENTTDPKGLVNKTNFDALGRTTATIANFVQNGSASDENIEVQYVYDGLGNLSMLTALNPTTGNQITRYLYEDSHNASLQTSAIYPDSSDANSNGTDQVKTEYDLAGNVMKITDQNGTVRTFVFDIRRRLVVDQVTTLGNGVDGTVRKIFRSYNAFGAMETISSLDAQNAVLNEVKYEYDANQKLKKLYQSHSGAVATTTPFMEYSYDNVNRSRLSGVTYPGGKTLTYNYDNANRVVSISEGQTVLVSYVYDGAGSPMQTAYNGPGLTLNYTDSGLDRFGRIVNHGWMQGNTALVHILHDYDEAGNRTYRYDAVHAANSELYSYDEMDQIKSLDRGALNQSRDTISTPNHSEAWNFDKTGNWASYDRNGTTENRTHNAANEIQNIAGHDANGNMVLMPGLKGKYDAWNRLVEVRDTPDNLIASYEYNGANQRISKKIGNVVTKTFFNQQWQEIESQTGTETTAYIWGLRYIDDLVLRARGSEHLYSLADPNWNIVAIADAAGTVVERMLYSAFGKVSWQDEDFDAKTESEFDWNRTFTGQVIDCETGLMLYRNRFYHLDLGRFISRDPIGYDSNDSNIYRYVGNNSTLYFDPFGLVKTTVDITWTTISQTQCGDPRMGCPVTTRTIRHKYRVTVDYDAECVDEKTPKYTLNSVSGNYLGTMDSWGFSVFVVGFTMSTRLETTNSSSSESCPDGESGSILNETLHLKVIQRNSFGINPGIGPVSVDLGWSLGADTVVAQMDFPVTIACCVCEEE